MDSQRSQGPIPPDSTIIKKQINKKNFSAMQDTEALVRQS